MLSDVNLPGILLQYLRMGDHIVIIQTISNEEDDDQIKYPACEGYLNKWTNYIFGWQKRWIVLKDGTLSYYKTRNETGCGCRGAISLQNACIKVKFSLRCEICQLSLVKLC